MRRRTFLKTSAAAALAIPWLRGADLAENSASDEAVLARSREQIEKHRRGPGVVVVHGADGRPLQGVKVLVEQTRHDFLFGCNFFMFDRMKEAALEEAYRNRFAALLNYATLGFYWPYYEPRRGQPIYEYTDKVTAWCAERGITCKGHPLVWDYADPSWLPRDFGEIKALSNGRVRDLVQRYRDRIDIWDVVNEPTHLGRFNTRLGEWAMSMGAVPYVKEHLKIARAAHPRATLLVNDYRTDPPYRSILEALREDGRLMFDAIGIQSHMHGERWPLHRLWSVCDTYGAFNVPVHFTETTVVSGPRTGPGESWAASTPQLEALQAEYVPRFYSVLFGHPAVQAVTWWDFADRGAWQGAAAGWLRQDLSPKPVYDRMMDLIKRQWWTKVEGRTNAQGEFATRSFYGQYRVTAETRDGRRLSKEVHWQRGQENRFDLRLG